MPVLLLLVILAVALVLISTFLILLLLLLVFTAVAGVTTVVVVAAAVVASCCCCCCIGVFSVTSINVATMAEEATKNKPQKPRSRSNFSHNSVKWNKSSIFSDNGIS